MKSYIILRHLLATAYRSEKELILFGQNSEINLESVDLTGAPLDSWTAFLDAALKQRKLSKLFEYIAAENAGDSELLSLLPEAERELQKAGEAFSRLVDLTSIQIDEREVPEASHSFVSALDRLPKSLMDLAFSISPPKPEEVDDALKGESTIKAKETANRYHNECARLIAELIDQRERRAQDAAEKHLQIEKIRSLSPPNQPIMPSEPIILAVDSADDRKRSSEYYSRRMSEYTRDKAEYERAQDRYKVAQAQLPILEDELRERMREVERATNEIEQFRLTQVPILADLEDRIRVARDLDMRKCVAELLKESNRDFLHESAPLPTGRAGRELEGFARFLLAAVLAEKFQGVQRTSDQELTNAFTSGRENIEPILESKYEYVARLWLAAVGFTLDSLTRNKKLLGQIEKRLNRLSEDELNRKLEQLNELERVQMPIVPEYQKLVSPADLDRAECECLNRMQSLSTHLSNLEEELGEGGRDLAERVAAAQSDADQVLGELHDNAEGALRVAHRMEILLNLASRAVLMMGSWAIGFCNSLRLEAERRAGSPVEELLRRSVTHSFWRADAQKLIKCHKSAYYVGIRSTLQNNLKDGKNRIQELSNSCEEIRKQPERIRDKYISRFRRSVPRAAIPLVNLLGSLGQKRDIIWLREALESTVPAYVELATKGRQLIRKGLLTSVVTLALLVLLTLSGILYVLWWDELVSVTMKQFLEEYTLVGIDPLLLLTVILFILTLVYGFNTYLMARNLSRWDSLVRSAPGRAAGALN